MISGLYTLTELEEAIAADPLLWRPLVFTNGCFDMIHAGHVRYLQAAKALGRSLVVGLNSDTSVQAIKPQQLGFPSRPIVPEMQRAEVLAALKPVTAVVIFADTTAIKLIERLKPDIYVKGGDYLIETLPEGPAAQAIGCEISFVKVEVPSSTTALINRILEHSQRDKS
ncbi:adenylyltransferase/cytidyltransferase family protein [Kamptonema sp. UHCC 0994]|uniref:adenylyltransferase/cytidyltransferase family protein n=1 Tax=Kamptonema sp. UHCC 0994 TaxID=3031329 RepID=UPI0023BA14BC|nr:adenylyltransferase/cytidyltransferase family protein [Kamptonema sp. UHCC 0994]MDF0553519.1 adenylyltransferase/cytidyltransferase family protein [Kamptonema sp. UHCC 0994]